MEELSHRQYRLEDENRFLKYCFSRSISCAGKYARSDSWSIKTQELAPEEYPFGVIENGHAFLPMFERKGAVFRKLGRN